MLNKTDLKTNSATKQQPLVIERTKCCLNCKFLQTFKEVPACCTLGIVLHKPEFDDRKQFFCSFYKQQVNN